MIDNIGHIDLESWLIIHHPEVLDEYESEMLQSESLILE